jgi:hypothetical protein
MAVAQRAGASRSCPSLLFKGFAVPSNFIAHAMERASSDGGVRTHEIFLFYTPDHTRCGDTLRDVDCVFSMGSLYWTEVGQTALCTMPLHCITGAVGYFLIPNADVYEGKASPVLCDVARNLRVLSGEVIAECAFTLLAGDCGELVRPRVCVSVMDTGGGR